MLCSTVRLNRCVRVYSSILFVDKQVKLDVLSFTFLSVSIAQLSTRCNPRIISLLSFEQLVVPLRYTNISPTKACVPLLKERQLLCALPSRTAHPACLGLAFHLLPGFSLVVPRTV